MEVRRTKMLSQLFFEMLNKNEISFEEFDEGGLTKVILRRGDIAIDEIRIFKMDQKCAKILQGTDIPQSYMDFLMKCNGIRNIDSDINIFGVADKINRQMNQPVDLFLQSKSLDNDDEIYVAQIEGDCISRYYISKTSPEEIIVRTSNESKTLIVSDFLFFFQEEIISYLTNYRFKSIAITARGA
jgi:hypothetical protein